MRQAVHRGNHLCFIEGHGLLKRCIWVVCPFDVVETAIFRFKVLVRKRCAKEIYADMGVTPFVPMTLAPLLCLRATDRRQLCEFHDIKRFVKVVD